MENGVLLQGFHWYIKPEEKLWKQLQEKVKSYKEMGFSAIWLPPAYKGVGGIHDNGYGVYDLYDLGEFNQKGSIETKYGTNNPMLSAPQLAIVTNATVPINFDNPFLSNSFFALFSPAQSSYNATLTPK